METARGEFQQLEMNSLPENSVNNACTNNENENTANSNNKLPTVKTTPTKQVNSSLNPNAIPFYPFQQLQNFNVNQMNTVIDVNANVGHAGPVNLNNMSVFQQSSGQILVLTLPTGLPIHNQSGLQMPQMIIPLQIPVPAQMSTDHNYHLNPNMAANLNSTATSSECTTPASESVHSDTSVEYPRYSSSPMMVDLSLPLQTNGPPISTVSDFNIPLPVDCYAEEQVVTTEETQITATPTIPDVKPVPRYKIPSPTKMTTRARNRKVAIEVEKKPSEVIPVKSTAAETKGSKRKAKGQKSKPQIQMEEQAKLPEIKVELEPATETVPIVETEETNNNAKKAGKVKKTAKTRGKAKNKAEVSIDNVAIKQEPEIVIKTEQGLIQATTSGTVIKTEPEEINQVKIKAEPVEIITVKKEPVDYEEMPNVEVKIEDRSNAINISDDDELPEIFTTENKVKTEIQNLPQSPESIPQTVPTYTAEERRIFDQEVEHYSKPAVQCAMFFPKLAFKRQNVRGGTCSVEYALSGRSRCRICKETILKEELRFGINMIDYDIQRVVDHWHHARCFWGTYKVASAYSISGLHDLSEKDRQLVYECSRQLK